MGWSALRQALRRTLKSPGAFGEPVTYRYAAGGEDEILGIFRRTHTEADAEGVLIMTTTPNIKVDLVDLSSDPAQGDEVVYGGAQFRVSAVETDGNGGATLLLVVGD